MMNLRNEVSKSRGERSLIWACDVHVNRHNTNCARYIEEIGSDNAMIFVFLCRFSNFLCMW